jgi:hypothetical protein
MRVAVCVVTLALAAAASGAIEPPSTLGSARLGSLTVTSSALVSQKTVELMGGRERSEGAVQRESQAARPRRSRLHPCRRPPRRVARSGVFKSANCAEGGPNVGFTLTARKLGFACSDGTWKPAIQLPHADDGAEARPQGNRVSQLAQPQAQVLISGCAT